MSDRSQGETALVQFSERLTNSAAFGTLFRKAWIWSRRTAAYLERRRPHRSQGARSCRQPYLRDRKHAADHRLDAAGLLLLLHRAVKEGEMTLSQANREKDQGQALRRRSRPGGNDRKLPGAVAALIALRWRAKQGPPVG